MIFNNKLLMIRNDDLIFFHRSYGIAEDFTLMEVQNMSTDGLDIFISRKIDEYHD